jgi:prepilin-type processing-associated H-X9-DG protein
MYTENNEGYFHNGDISDWRHLWMEALWPYYGNFKDITLCPMAVRRSGLERQGQNEMGTTFTTWSVFTGNYAWDREGFFGSYGINGWTRNPPPEITAQYQGNFPTENNWRRPDVKGAWQIPLFLDCRWPDGWMDHRYEPPGEEDASTWARFCINRHHGHVNSLFVDGSVRKVGLKALWTFKWHRQCETRGPWTLAGGVCPEDWPAWMRRCKDY